MPKHIIHVILPRVDTVVGPNFADLQVVVARLVAAMSTVSALEYELVIHNNEEEFEQTKNPAFQADIITQSGLQTSGSRQSG